jgi:hypothetical protein
VSIAFSAGGSGDREVPEGADREAAEVTDQAREQLKGNTDPVRTRVPGRWRITLSGVMPEGSWRARLLELAQAMPEAQKLGLTVEGSTLEFTCPDTDDQGVLRDHLHTRIRLINLLIREAGGFERQP